MSFLVKKESKVDFRRKQKGRMKKTATDKQRDRDRNASPIDWERSIVQTSSGYNRGLHARQPLIRKLPEREKRPNAGN